MNTIKYLLFSLIICATHLSQASSMVKGMNLTEIGQFIYDAHPINSQQKTDAQIAVDQMYELGVRHIMLNPRARMTDPKGNSIVPVISNAQRSDERKRYGRLIKYIHSKKMTVGIRPIFFVVKPNGDFPYIEKDSNGGEKLWWHGNIQPSDPNRWFQSFKSYLDIYLLISKIYRVEEFTIAAELYSMTVGIEDQWDDHPHGFPSQWLKLSRYTRRKLGSKVRIMYDINFTDDKVTVGGEQTSLGGELERWRYRLVDLAFPEDPKEQEIWKTLVSFWNSLDAVGIDMYRSLASEKDILPTEYSKLVAHLQTRSDEYASQLDITMVEIESTTNKHQVTIFKEVGFRSVDKGFINPFNYANKVGNYNEEHQAAAYEALMLSFWAPQFDWFSGASFWDVSIDPLRNSGPGDLGFSPLGKSLTEEIIKEIFR